MARPYDVTGKELLEASPSDWLGYFGQPRPPEKVRVIDSDVSTVTLVADKVIRVEDDEPWILHLELQTGRDAGLLNRLLSYQALLRHRHGVPVATALLLMRVQADAPELTGELRLAAPVGREWNFRYEVVRLWQQPHAAFLNGPPVLLPLAPLADVDEAAPPGVVSQMKRRLDAEVPKPLAHKLWESASILMGMRYSPALVEQLEQIMLDTSDSVTWQIFREREARGKLTQARDTLLRQGAKRFGPPAELVTTQVQAMKDLEKLNALLDRVLDAADWDDLLAGA
jgi:hypothetical protein